MIFKKVSMMNSNALSMLWNMAENGNDTNKWNVPKTERDGFFGKFDSNANDYLTEVPDDWGPSATVSKDGKGEDDGSKLFKTVQEAIDAASLNLTTRNIYVINVKAGVYDETIKIKLHKDNIKLIGEGIGKTIIIGKSTFEVSGDVFMARGITFKNEAGSKSKEAVVFKSSSDQSFLDSCEFIGHQGALHSVAGRQLYQSCKIEGNDDVIFGNGAAFFKQCDIFVNPRPETPEKGEENAIAAQGRTDPTQQTGFVFNNCTVNGTPEYMKLFESDRAKHKNFLGRPLGEFARTVFINSSLDSIIDPAGWTEREGDKSSSTLYFGEFKNNGTGSDLKGRVPWSSQIPAEDSVKYSIPNFFGSREWLPYQPHLYW